MSVQESVSKTEKFEAKTENFPKVWEFVSGALSSDGVDEMILMQIELAVEEVFVNISSYAYPDTEGEAEISVKTEGGTVIVQFADSGVAFNPVEAPEPDMDIPLLDREAGGFGIFLTKKMMDEIEYCYENGRNILTLKKHFA